MPVCGYNLVFHNSLSTRRYRRGRLDLSSRFDLVLRRIDDAYFGNYRHLYRQYPFGEQTATLYSHTPRVPLRRTFRRQIQCRFATTSCTRRRKQGAMTGYSEQILDQVARYYATKLASHGPTARGV